MTKSQGRSWVEILQEHMEKAHLEAFNFSLQSKGETTIHKMLYGVDLSSGDDQSVTVTGRLSGTEPRFIIIDEIQPLLGEELFDFIRELGIKEKKPKPPIKQPSWARHNQAPRSFRRHK